MAEIAILPVRPGSLSDEDKTALRAAGVVVVEHKRPDELRLLRPTADVPAGDMLLAAVKALTEQKAAICDLIDAIAAETVCLDWEGTDVSKAEAKRYVMEYGSSA